MKEEWCHTLTKIILEFKHKSITVYDVNKRNDDCKSCREFQWSYVAKNNEEIL